MNLLLMLHCAAYVVIYVLSIASAMIMSILLLLALDVKFKFMPYRVWHEIGVLLTKFNFNKAYPEDGRALYERFTSFGSRIEVSGLENLPTDRNLFFYQTHVAYYGFDLLTAHMYNNAFGKDAKIIATTAFPHTTTLTAVHLDLQKMMNPKYKYYPPTYLIEGAREMITQSLNDAGSIFIVATGLHVNTLQKYENRHQMYEARYFPDIFKFKPGFLELSEGATLVPIDVEVNFPWWVRLIGRLPAIIVSTLHNDILTRQIYSGLVMTIKFRKPLDDVMVNADRVRVAQLRREIKELRKNTEDLNRFAGDAKINARREELQNILDKYQSLIYQD